jgi:hypothetical protein
MLAADIRKQKGLLFGKSRREISHQRLLKRWKG